MNYTRPLSVLFSLLLITSIIPLVDATITKKYNHNEYDEQGNLLYSFKVKMVVATEENDTWLRDNYYRIDFVIKLAYVNESILEGYDFIFYSPSLRDFTGDYEVTNNMTTLNPRVRILGTKGTLALYVKPRPVEEKRVSLKPVIYIQQGARARKDYRYDWFGFWWEAQEKVYVNVKSPSLFSSELFYILAGIIISAVAVGTFLVVRLRKRKSNPLRIDSK